ncbi:MAG: hypothetical protein WC046_07560 [Candidatus Bathyarchaeia archaeon]
MAKDQKISELTHRLNSVKKRLALAVSSSSTKGSKLGDDINTQFETQTKILEGKRKIATNLLNKNVNDTFNEIAKLKIIKTNNPIKRVSIFQQTYKLEKKLAVAKKALQTNSNSKKNTKRRKKPLGKVQTLEKDIAKKVGR